MSFTQTIAYATLVRLTAAFASVRMPQSNDLPLPTPESVSDNLDARMIILGTPAFVVEQTTHDVVPDGLTMPHAAYRNIGDAREGALKLTARYDGRAAHQAREALTNTGVFTNAGITTTIRATTIAALIDALPRQYAAAVERQRALLASEDWWKAL